MKRRIISFMIIALSVGAIYQVASYSTAQVKNTTSVAITSPEDALIAMPDKLELKATRTTTSTKSIVSEEGKDDIVNVQSQSEIGPPNSNFYIKNNMNHVINVKVFLDRGFSKKQNSGVFIKNNLEVGIRPGEKREITFDVDEGIKNDYLDVVVWVDWDHGSAEIRSEMEVEVSEKTQYNENIIHIQTDNDHVDVGESNMIEENKGLEFKKPNSTESEQENVMIEEVKSEEIVNKEEQETDERKSE